MSYTVFLLKPPFHYYHFFYHLSQTPKPTSHFHTNNSTLDFSTLFNRHLCRPKVKNSYIWERAINFLVHCSLWKGKLKPGPSVLLKLKPSSYQTDASFLVTASSSLFLSKRRWLSLSSERVFCVHSMLKKISKWTFCIWWTLTKPMPVRFCTVLITLHRVDVGAVW